MRDDLTRQLFEAFVAGFKCSGEGWNGEYPFADKDIDVAADTDVQAAFGDFMHKREKVTDGG